MKPLNLDNSPCSPVSSNCVIWAGPNIPCINLCKGDTISDVTFKLAAELCTILDYLNVQNYDLTCFNLAACGPNNYQELLQFLIDRICAVENVPASVATTTSASVSTRSPEVSSYLMTASPCFGGGTVTLVDYVQQAATQICNIFVEINIINSGISSLNTRVATLEVTPVPSFIIPSFILQCEIGTIIPTLAAGSTQDIDVVLSRFINEEWCPYKATFGSVTDLASSILAQCILGTDDALAVQYTSPGTQMQVAYPAYVASPTTLANAVNNLWIALCDLRNAGKALVTVTAGNNVTVTPTVSLVGSDELTDYTIDALSSVVTAGDNITVTPTGPVAGVTTYTIAGKEAIVVGADDIVVTPVTVGNDTTYTISRPKEVSYNEAIGSINVDDDPVPNTAVFHFPLGYNSLTYTNTTGVTKDYIVNVSFDTEIPTITATPVSIFNLIAGGIITTALGIDTIEWESSAASTQHGVSLFDGPTITDIVDITTTEKVQTVPGVLDVEARFKIFSAAKNVSCFKRLTLNNNESVSLKFKTLIAGYEAYVVQAQIYVQEI
jgi:hypothetical protein